MSRWGCRLCEPRPITAPHLILLVKAPQTPLVCLRRSRSLRGCRQPRLLLYRRNSRGLRWLRLMTCRLCARSSAGIARAAEPLENITVVEIGPGPGGLTRALLSLGARRIIGIERDERAIAALQEIAEHYPGRLEIVAGDALSIDPRDQLGPERARVVANLPYNIATALLIGWLTVEPWPPWYDSLL